MHDRQDDTATRDRFLVEDPAAIERVRGWVHAQVSHGWRFPDPEAVSQEIVLELLTLARRGRIERTAGFRGYVRTVARNTCIDLHRRRRLREDTERPDDGAAVEAIDPSPEARAIERQRRALIRAVLQCLDPNCRELLRMAYGERMKAREIGERLGIREGNVRVRLHRCVQRARELRANLDLDGDGTPGGST